MGLTRLAVDRPLVVAMAIAALLLLGLRAWFQLPTELDPRVSFASLTITVTLPGAGPAEIERRVQERRETVVRALEALQEQYTKAGKLDEAIAIRDYLRAGGPDRAFTFRVAPPAIRR